MRFALLVFAFRQAEAESFAVEHFPALLAVAKAAVEMRKRFDDAEVAADCTCSNCTAATAFDAAVRGEGKEKANG